MPIAPRPYKLVCPKCAFSKTVRLKSDALSGKDMLQMSIVCPRCGTTMNKEALNKFDRFIEKWFK